MKRKTDWWRLGLVMLGSLAIGGFIVSKVWIVPEMPPLEQGKQQNPKTEQHMLTVGSATLQVEVRKTEAEQALGLSWRASMGPDEGMVFVYRAPQKVLYWMKGMNFPLDFLWVAHGIVTQVTEGVPAPDATNRIPKTVVPVGEVDMVIEVNAGWVAAHKIMVGDAVLLKN